MSTMALMRWRRLKPGHRIRLPFVEPAGGAKFSARDGGSAPALNNLGRVGGDQTLSDLVTEVA